LVLFADSSPLIFAYTLDAPGNRLWRTLSVAMISATFDNNDRQLTDGPDTATGYSAARPAGGNGRRHHRSASASLSAVASAMADVRVVVTFIQ